MPPWPAVFTVELCVRASLFCSLLLFLGFRCALLGGGGRARFLLLHSSTCSLLLLRRFLLCCLCFRTLLLLRCLRLALDARLLLWVLFFARRLKQR